MKQMEMNFHSYVYIFYFYLNNFLNFALLKKANEENPDMIEKAKIEEENLRKLKNLFKGLKFFLNREVPREQFVFAIK